MHKSRSKQHRSHFHSKTKPVAIETHIFLRLPNTPAVGLVCLFHTEEISVCAAACKEPALLLQRQSATVPQEMEVVSNGEELSRANTESVRNFP